jgi:hypothetical protein
VNNCEQFTPDTIRGRTRRAVQNLRVDVQRRIDVGVSPASPKGVSAKAGPMSCASTLPGTPFSCDHDEYVRRNVSQVARGLGLHAAAAAVHRS